MIAKDSIAESVLTLSNAVELGINLVYEITGKELSDDVLSEQGREGVGLLLLSKIRTELTNRKSN